MILLSRCQSEQIEEKLSLNSRLKAALGEIISNSAEQTSMQDVQSVCIEKYNGYGEAFEITNRYIKGYRNFKIPRISDCATVSVSDSVFPKTIIIDYGAGCEDFRHHSITGKIVINITDTIIKAGAVKTIEFQNVYIDSMKVDLSATIKNLGLNAENKWVLLKSSTQKITTADGDIILKVSNDTIIWENGFETTNKNDDVYYKTGNSTITINDTISYSKKIISPLLYDSCRNITKGIVEIFKNNKNVIIDYGDGTCDNIATVTADGVTEEIELNMKNGKGPMYKENGNFKKHIERKGKRGNR